MGALFDPPPAKNKTVGADRFVMFREGNNFLTTLIGAMKFIFKDFSHLENSASSNLEIGSKLPAQIIKASQKPAQFSNNLQALSVELSSSRSHGKIFTPS